MTALESATQLTETSSVCVYTIQYKVNSTSNSKPFLYFMYCFEEMYQYDHYLSYYTLSFDTLMIQTYSLLHPYVLITSQTENHTPYF